MSTNTLVRDELLDQVLEDERAAALQEWRERGEIVIEPIDCVITQKACATAIKQHPRDVVTAAHAAGADQQGRKPAGP
jgi:hypothetical protein